jgi:hypothetical protein
MWTRKAGRASRKSWIVSLLLCRTRFRLLYDDRQGHAFDTVSNTTFIAPFCYPNPGNAIVPPQNGVGPIRTSAIITGPVLSPGSMNSDLRYQIWSVLQVAFLPRPAKGTHLSINQNGRLWSISPRLCSLSVIKILCIRWDVSLITANSTCQRLESRPCRSTGMVLQNPEKVGNGHTPGKSVLARSGQLEGRTVRTGQSQFPMSCAFGRARKTQLFVLQNTIPSKWKIGSARVLLTCAGELSSRRFPTLTTLLDEPLPILDFIRFAARLSFTMSDELTPAGRSTWMSCEKWLLRT